MTSLANYRREDSIGVVTLDDGKRNALSPQMLAAINAALDQAEQHQVPLVVAGREGTFSAGFDLGVLMNGGGDATAMLRAGFELGERLLRFPTPVVIACTGHGLAMGSFLLLAADYRIGAGGPFKIGANEVAIGITMPYFAIEICRQRLSPAHFHRAVITAEIYSPEAAVDAGFLDRVVPAGEVVAAAREVAAQFAKLNLSAHAATKLRAREHTLRAIRTAIEADIAALA